jgi:hypothetical protein
MLIVLFSLSSCFLLRVKNKRSIFPRAKICMFLSLIQSTYGARHCESISFFRYCFIRVMLFVQFDVFNGSFSFLLYIRHVIVIFRLVK